MTDAETRWSRFLRAVNDARDLDALGRASVDLLERLGAEACAAWTRLPQGDWRQSAAHGTAPTSPEDCDWPQVGALAARLEVVVAWSAPDLGDVETLLGLSLESALRRLAAESATRAATQSGGQRLATVLDASPDAVLVVDPRGQIIHANARAAELFGHDLDELIGGGIDQLVPDDVRSRHASLRGSYMVGPSQRAMAAGQDLRARRRDGTEFPVDIALAPIEADGEQAVAAFVRDATARHQAEVHRQQLRDAELARHQALELNDNVVQGLTASVWLMEIGDVPEALHAARRTLASARRMMRDLLDDNQIGITPGRLQRSNPVPASGLQPRDPEIVESGDAPLRLVVADDSEDIRLLMEVRLRGVPEIELVAMASDGLEAVAAVDEHEPDVVLMDLSMPRLDGLEATARIRARHPKVRVVVLTGHPRATIEAQALAAGADAVAEKGGSFDLLLQQVRGQGVA